MQPYEKAMILFLAKHMLTGAAGGIVLGLGLLALDVANLRTLATQTEYGLTGILLLFFGLVITFGSVSIGAGIMSLGSSSDDANVRDRD